MNNRRVYQATQRPAVVIKSIRKALSTTRKRWKRVDPSTPFQELLTAPRYQPMTVEVQGQPFGIADSLSFYWSYQEIFEKEIEGFGELFRWLSFKKIGTSTIQSRAIAGVAGGTYIFALPGSTGACKDAWDEILQYQLDIRFRPSNFVEIMPRLREHELYGRAS